VWGWEFSGLEFRSTGSVPVLLVALLFLASCLGLGIWVISTRATTQFEAETSSLIFMLFGLLFDGSLSENRHAAGSQLIGDIAPLTYFIRISRGIYMKGVGLSFCGGGCLDPCYLYSDVVGISSKTFKMRLD